MTGNLDALTTDSTRMADDTYTVMVATFFFVMLGVAINIKIIIIVLP